MTDGENGFVLDIVTHLLEMARSAKRSAEDGGDYEKGRHFALYEALSLIREQALAFNISTDQIGMTALNLDIDIL